MQTAPPVGLFYFFPFLFAGLWLFATTLLSSMCCWYKLMNSYPDRPEAAVLKMSGQSGMMGLGVSMRGILTLSGCPSGLRVAIWRVFGPFSRPFFVPWDEIGTRQKTMFFETMVRIGFGNPEKGVLSVSAYTWQRLIGAVADREGRPSLKVLPHISETQRVREIVIQWAAMTALAAAFFYGAPHLMGSPAEGPPLAVCIGCPAFVFGLSQLWRYFKRQ